MNETEFESLVIEGYASRFGQVDNGGDVVRRGAFFRTLLNRQLRDVKMLWQHDPEKPVGRWLQLYEDQRGLFVKGVLNPALFQGREAAQMIRSGLVDGLSIGFKARKATRDRRSGLRQILSVDLWEISLVTFPLLSSARLQVRD
ncbi:HK97 family phage prohead protease [Flexibacterium corallicola]|uniref:HK97 family phage prohead protease n=1 Tax=Flexibacterium corallicola TaxID=3037259 RepID=UPI00286F3A2E|nr:HK97 family phage prohead protease [Pseudovibrio sp. M1P-2-3]